MEGTENHGLERLPYILGASSILGARHEMISWYGHSGQRGHLALFAYDVVVVVSLNGIPI